jgi:DNA-binding response OmpR family regulator
MKFNIQEGGLFMKTILIVDDEKKILNLHGKMLCREGFNILKASHAEEAHEKLLRNHIDLVLLDINMTDEDVSILFELIREFFPQTKIIVTSLFQANRHKLNIKEEIDYYDKSDNIRVLIQKVRAAITDSNNDNFYGQQRKATIS